MKGLQIFNDKAAGIDVGSESLHTSIAGDTPKVFGTMTADLYALRDHLVANGVRTVAMEATGIYWLCVFEVLEAEGAHPRKGEILFIDARNLGHLINRRTKELSHEDIQQIANTYHA